MADQKHKSRRDFLVEFGMAATGVAVASVLPACGKEEDCNCDNPGTPQGGGTSGEVGTGGTQICNPVPTTGGSGGASTQQATGGATAGGNQSTSATATCPAPTQCATSDTLPSEWDLEADVVVLGTGFAGLSAAISAADAGANVLLLEKMPEAEEGGNSIISGNMWWTPTSAEEGAKYIKALCMGLTDDAWIQTLAEEMAGLNQWLATVNVTASPLGVFQPEYPELPSSTSVRTWNSSGGLWKPLRAAVASRPVEVLYESPAVDLIQDPGTREVKGVVARSGGRDINIKAKRGVILACGGFEFDYGLQAQFLPAWPVYCQGSPGNTGDGVRMAQKVGAELWHMNNALAHVGCFVRDTSDPKSIPIPVSVPAGAILVDRFGSRFMNEKREDRHGFGHKEYLLFFDGLKQCFSRIPSYLIIDDTTRKASKLAGGLLGWFGKFGNYSWSADNSAELASGWLKQGQTLNALATAIGADPTTLSATVTRYNGFCTAGADQDFGRSASTLKALTTAPYYALPIHPLMYNTQGGPRRNPKCQVVAPSGAPIPRLYSAGELGSAWGWMYNGGGNASEAVITGRIAGKNSAAEGPWA